VVSAHLRSLQADISPTCFPPTSTPWKPWFNGKLDVAPPVIDLTRRVLP